MLASIYDEKNWRQYTALMYSFSYLEPVCCSMSSSNCCFLTCIQISQEAGQVVWYSHLFQNFPQLMVGNWNHTESKNIDNGELLKEESSRKTSISALLTMPKPLTVCVTINCGKFWKRWEYQTTWSASWEICMQVRKQQLELDMEQQTGSK